MNLIAIKIIGTSMVLYSFFIINCVNNLLIFLDLVKIHCDHLYADKATRCPQKSYSTRTPCFLFLVARNSLKYGKKYYFIAYFYEFYPTSSQNRVTIGPKFVL